MVAANGHHNLGFGDQDPQDDNVAINRLTKPLIYSGSLENYKLNELTPAIGREYIDISIPELLHDPDSTQKIQDLAAVISQRGVVVFRDQHELDPSHMRELIEKLSYLAGSPESSTLHVHPLTEEGSELGDQISVISSAKQKKGGGLTHQQSDNSRLASVGWHSDITFETVPSDYAMLKIHTLPPTGGDTVSRIQASRCLVITDSKQLWASGYEIYDRLSPSMATFLEGLTATHDASFFHDEARRLGNPLRTGERGSPLNKGEDLRSIHPVIRTNRK